MKILAFPSPSNARAYRLDSVGKYIEATSKNSFYITMDPMNDNDLENADVIILQQTISPEKIAQVVKYRDKGKLLVAELDDGFGANPDNPFIDKHKELELSKWLEVLCGVADVITTTTDYLADTIRAKLKQNKVKKDIVVLPNYLDMQKWDLPILKNYADEIRLLWAGSCTHRDDMAFIAPVIKKLAKTYPKLKFIHCGDVKLKPLFEGINSEYIDATPIEAWPSKLHSLRADIGVVPLLDNEFNRCKSNLKYLEFGISGIPSVFSRVVYSETVEDGKTGLLASTKEEFFEKVSLLIENLELRTKMGVKAYVDVRSNYDIENHAHDWLNTYWRHLSKKKPLKIDIGSGIQPIVGANYVHLDVHPKFGEMVNDILEGIPVVDGSVEELRVSMVVEHLYIHDLKEKALPEFYRVLAKKGRLYIVVPDWQKIKKSTNWSRIQQNLHGTYHDYIPPEHDLHKNTWDFPHLKKVLEKAGFNRIKKIPYKDMAHDPDYTLAMECFK